MDEHSQTEPSDPSVPKGGEGLTEANSPLANRMYETGTKRVFARRDDWRLAGLVDLDRIRSRRREIEQRWPDIVPQTDDRDKETILRDLTRRIETHDWTNMTLAFVARAGRIAFEPAFRRQPDHAALRAFFVREIAATSSQAFLSAMMSIYLASFVPKAEHTRALGGALVNRFADLPSRFRLLAERVPEIFEAADGAKQLGLRMAGMDDVYRGLEDCGFRQPHLPGLIDHAHLAFVETVAPRLGRPHEIGRMLAWLKPEGVRDAKTTHAGPAVEALLLAMNGAATPEPVRVETFKRLIKLYGDPRTARNSAWPAPGSEAMQSILRWLTGANIRFFMDVISGTNDSHMYEPRRRFWLELHERGLIDAAWVAFSDDAQAYASQLQKRSGQEGSNLSFGRQTAGGGRKETSLLLFQIGNCVVVEGSHSYKVHVFRREAPNAPRLFVDSYDCETIRQLPNMATIVHNPPGIVAFPFASGWQQRVFQLIEAYR